MTIADYFVRLTRNLSLKVPTAMDTENKQWLVDAANHGLHELVKLLPAVRRTETRVARLVAPVSKNITATAASAVISFTGGWAEAGANLGRTVVVGSDAERYNRLASATALQHTHEGATGATTLEVLSDAVLIGQYEDAVDGNVLLQEGGDMTALDYGRPSDLFEQDLLRMARGRPKHWWIEPLNGISGGADPKFLIRIWPQPEVFYQLRYTLRLWPTALTVADLASTTVLPIKAGEEGRLVDIAQMGLIASPLWVGTNNKEDAAAASARAMASLGGESENRGHTKPAGYGTPRGF